MPSASTIGRTVQLIVVVRGLPDNSSRSSWTSDLWILRCAMELFFLSFAFRAVSIDLSLDRRISMVLLSEFNCCPWDSRIVHMSRSRACFASRTSLLASFDKSLHWRVHFSLEFSRCRLTNILSDLTYGCSTSYCNYHVLVSFTTTVDIVQYCCNLIDERLSPSFLVHMLLCMHELIGSLQYGGLIDLLWPRCRSTP